MERENIHYSTATRVNAFLCAINCKPEARADRADRCALTQTDVAQRKLNVMTFSKSQNVPFFTA